MPCVRSLTESILVYGVRYRVDHRPGSLLQSRSSSQESVSVLVSRVCVGSLSHFTESLNHFIESVLVPGFCDGSRPGSLSRSSSRESVSVLVPGVCDGSRPKSLSRSSSRESATESVLVQDAWFRKRKRGGTGGNHRTCVVVPLYGRRGHVWRKLLNRRCHMLVSINL